MAVSFRTFDIPGDCGDLTTTGGAPTTTNLVCSGLYTGGGGNSVPLPYAVPDQGFAVNAITACTGQSATLGATTSTQTGSNRSCTAPGCLFGAPLAVPNPGSTPTSVCVLNAVGGTANGMLDCSTGTTTLDLPLSSVIYLSGDVTTQTGLQPCPVCRGPVDGEVCIGGPNNGLGCDPGTSDLGGDPAYPTSHDCPPTASLNIGTLPIAFSLTTGTVTWSGTTATNDSPTTVAEQPRIFAGFCRDKAIPGASGAFQSPAKQCWQNGMAVGTVCGSDSSTFETCQQRTEGAFGPNGGANRTITVVGNGMSILSGSGGATLVSIFAIPPTFDATVDSAGDLPGPGAVSLVGTASLCSTAGTCP
jgi:hypothetical protein